MCNCTKNQLTNSQLDIISLNLYILNAEVRSGAVLRRGFAALTLNEGGSLRKPSITTKTNQLVIK
jgi:hypothetical protein